MTVLSTDQVGAINIPLYYCRLRPKSVEPPITGTTFHKFDLPVPQELRDFCTDEKVRNWSWKVSI